MRLPKGIIYIIMASLVGLLAMFTVDQYTTKKIRAHIKPMGSVVIAASDIPPGTGLNSRVIKTVAWPKELIPPQAATSAAELEGRVVKAEISQGELILLTKLAPWGTAAGLSGLVSVGKRAFTVRVDDVSGVAGFIHPGDQVDVLAELPIPNSQEHFSKTIVQNVKVLTAGQVWEQKGDLKPTVVSAVTLELTPEQGEVLNLASNQGKIRLALRNRATMDNAVTSGVATSQLINRVDKIATPEVAPTPKENKGARTVEVIKGLACSTASL